MKKYIVELTPEQRKELSEMIKRGKACERELTHARILLKADAEFVWWKPLVRLKLNRCFYA